MFGTVLEIISNSIVIVLCVLVIAEVIRGWRK